MPFPFSNASLWIVNSTWNKAQIDKQIKIFEQFLETVYAYYITYITFSSSYNISSNNVTNQATIFAIVDAKFISR